MKILGISNPNYMGVTIATKAICTDYLPLPDFKHTNQVTSVARAIIDYKPDILVVGGWSNGYTELLAHMKKIRKFPVIGVNHSTVFYGNVLGDLDLHRQYFASCVRKDIDIMAFVNPQMAEYYQVHKKIDAVWLPHYFPMKPKVEERSRFRIGVFGGTSFVKNTAGAVAIAQDFASKQHNVEVVHPQTYDIKHESFLDILGQCSMVIHLSHLEAYSNVLQEAWSRGIPALYSVANDGLVSKNPLLTRREKEGFENYFRLQNSNDPMQLAEGIRIIYGYWEQASDLVYQTYSNLTKRVENYTTNLFEVIARGYQNGGIYDTNAFAAPFDTGYYIEKTSPQAGAARGTVDQGGGPDHGRLSSKETVHHSTKRPF